MHRSRILKYFDLRIIEKFLIGASDKLVLILRYSVIDSQVPAEIIAYQESHALILQYVGVTSALFAQVTITSLQQPRLDQLHWIVNAIWTSALTMAAFAVFASFHLYRTLAIVKRPEYVQRLFSGLSTANREALAKLSPEEREIIQREDYGPHFVAYGLDLPRQFLNGTLISYLLGLGLYWYYSWALAVDEAKADGDPTKSKKIDPVVANRAVSIFFIVTVCMSLSWIFVTRRAIDQNDKAVTRMLRRRLKERAAERLLESNAHEEASYMMSPS